MDTHDDDEIAGIVQEELRMPSRGSERLAIKKRIADLEAEIARLRSIVATVGLPQNQDVLYRLHDVEAISGKGRSTIYRDMAAGKFPRPVQLGAQSVAWRKSDINAWLASLKKSEK